MRAGRLRHRITVEQQVAGSRDDYGQKTQTWEAFASSVAASIEPLQGREWIEARTEYAEVSHKIRMRHLAGITSKMRVKFGSRVFRIVAPPINPMERSRETVLMCKEIEA